MTEEKLELAFEVDNDFFKEIVGMWPRVLNPDKPQNTFVNVVLWLGIFLASLATFNVFSVSITFFVFFGGLLSGVVGCIIASHIMGMRYTSLLLRRRNALGAEGTHVQIAINADGIVEQTKTARRIWRWQGVDQIYPLPRGTAILKGLDQLAIADNALPEGMSPAEFRDWLKQLKATA